MSTKNGNFLPQERKLKLSATSREEFSHYMEDVLDKQIDSIASIDDSIRIDEVLCKPI